MSVTRILVVILLAGCHRAPAPRAVDPAAPYIVVLGVAQDGGYPQAGCEAPHCERGWKGERRHVASLAVIDPSSREIWIVDATPDFPWQLRMLRSEGRLAGILLTHAHVGHYTGLMHLGREAMGARAVPVFAMPRMKAFLETNGPWNQLVRLNNIALQSLGDGTTIRLNQRLSITPFRVPHRDEYSETVGFRIEGPARSLVYIPDIDKWETWNRPIEEVIRGASLVYVDGTFYAEGELPGRNMSEIPHPFIVETMMKLDPLPESERRKVRFIHLNHTNPALFPGEASEMIRRRGYRVAREGERESL